MKVVININSLTCGGAERVSAALANFLAGQDHELVVITMHSEEMRLLPVCTPIFDFLSSHAPMKLDSMKVAIINQHIAYAVGGSELQCNFLAMGLSERGHRVTYIAPSRPQEQVRGYSYEIVAVNDSSRSIVDVVLASRPDVVYWRYNKRHFRAVSEALAKAQIPMVFAAAHINDFLPWAVKPAKDMILPTCSGHHSNLVNWR